MPPVTNEIIGRRLEKVRKDLGLSLEFVATQIDLNCYQVLRNIEKGSRPVRAAELAKLSKLYYRDLSYFLVGDEAREEQRSLAWRKDPSVAATKQLEAKVLRLLMDYNLLEELTSEAPPARFAPWDKGQVEMGYKGVSRKAEQLGAELGLGPRPGLSLSDIIENKLGAKLLHLKMEDGVSAVSAIGDFGYAIIVNSEEAPWRRRFNLAHELFHLYASNITPLGEVHASDDVGRTMTEKYADAFAAALLLPEEHLKEAVRSRAQSNCLEPVDIIDIALDFAVSSQALLYRMQNLGLLTSPSADEIIASEQFIRLNREFRRQHNQPAQEFSSHMVLLALKAMQHGKISKGRVCKMFDVSKTEFPTFLMGRGYPKEIEDIDDTAQVVLSNTRF